MSRVKTALASRMLLCSVLLGAWRAALAARADDGPAASPEDYRAELHTLCNAGKLSGAMKEKDPAQRAVVIASYLSQQGFGPRYQELFDSLYGMSVCDRSRRILEEARKNGVARCPFAEDGVKETRDVCKQIRSIKDELALLCRAEHVSGAARERDPNARYLKIRSFYLTRPMSPEFGRFFVELDEGYPCDRAAMLEARVKAVGISRCAIAAGWRRDFCAAKQP